MKRKKHYEKIISCLASNYKQPIAVLVERLLAVQLPEQPDGKSRESEVDYAIALITLLVLQFESLLSRARHFDKDTKEKYAMQWMVSLNDTALDSIIKRLNEVYFLRNAIAHNHIWSYTQHWEEGKAYYSNFDLNFAWQSSEKEFKKIVGGKLPYQFLPSTRLLGLVVVPDFIGRKDVAIVFKTIKDVLDILYKAGHIDSGSGRPTVRFNDKLSYSFWSLIGQIQRSYISQSRGK
ncbi:MAG: hypothetical protein WC742_10175 [Gallionellaceae bacterium]